MEAGYFYKIKEVRENYDGDTVDVIIDLGFNIFIKDRVRLLDIDTEEMKGTSGDDKWRAEKAKTRLNELLHMGSVFIKTEKDKKGKYGRILGRFYVDIGNGKVVDVVETLKAEGYQKGNQEPLVESIVYATTMPYKGGK